MKETLEKKYFASPDGGLNADDVDAVIAINQWVNMENCRVGSTDKGVTGVVESVGGTLLLSAAQPSVSFICIGGAVDEARNRFFYFLCNKYTPDHKILCYAPDDNIIYTVLLSTQVTGGLNFNKNYPIHSARVIGDLLYWTDGNVSQKRINVEAAIKLNNPSYVTDEDAYTAPLSQSVIELIRRPYGLPVTAAKGTAGGFANNFISEFSGQFASAFIYRDGEETVASCPSEMINFNFPTDTYNFVQITFPLSETFDQDVQIIQLLVRFNNEPDYFIIKQWNKDNSTDLAEITAHNNGITNLTFNFYNNTEGIGFGSAKSVKPEDSVPRTSQALEYADNKIFLANNLKGFNTPASTSLTAALSANGSDPTYAMQLKANGSYQIAIRFRDNSKRSIGFAVTNANCVVTNADRSYATLPYNSIAWALSNALPSAEIPAQAYYYDILVTKCLTTRYFLQTQAVSLRYAIKNANGTYSYTNTYGGNVYGIAVNISYLVSIGYGYTFNAGDLCRLYLSSTATVYEREILDVSADQLIIKAQNIGSLNTPPSCIFEIYTPYRKSESETLFTTGQSYKITNPATDSRRYSTTSGIITGDTVRYKPGSFRNEIMSPSIANQNLWTQFYGEKFGTGTLGEVSKTNFIQWSNTIIEGSRINGLSTFDALDEKSLPTNMGAIRKLQNTSKIEAQGNIMLAICEDETASLYLGQEQLTGDDGNIYLAATSKTIGTVNVLRGSFGTTNPESVVEYRGSVFWVDVKNGRVIQYSTNGLFPISNYKMTRFWKLFCDQYNSMTSDEIEALGGRPFIFTTVDPYHDELLISIPKLLSYPPKGYLPDYPSTVYPFDIWDGQGKTIVYKLGTNPNYWQGSYAFNPEFFITLQNKLYSASGGQLYLHNQTTNYNEFYGTQYKSRVMPIWNIEPSVPKAYNTIKVEANMLPTLVYFRSESPYEQASDLVDFDFMNYEGLYYAALYRNKLIPTAIGFNTNGLLTAEKMRTYALRVLLEFTVSTVPMQLRFVTMGFDLSRGHTP